MEGLLVVRLQLVLILALELILVKVQINCDLFVFLKLHHNKGVSSLALAQGWVKTHDKHVVYLVGLRKYHELLNSLVLNLVVICFASKSEGCLVHVDVETTSVKHVSNQQDGTETRHGVCCMISKHTWG
jgi:hypothetical protein